MGKNARLKGRIIPAPQNTGRKWEVAICIFGSKEMAHYLDNGWEPLGVYQANVTKRDPNTGEAIGQGVAPTLLMRHKASPILTPPPGLTVQ